MVGDHLRRYARRAAEIACQRAPIESRARIGLAAGRDMLMANHGVDRITLRGRAQQTSQRRVLRRLESFAFVAFDPRDSDAEL